MSTTSKQPEPNSARSRTRSVLLVALVLRLLVLWSFVAHNPPSWFFNRGMEMGLLAKSLLAGQGLGSPFGRPTGPTAFIAPVYPILIAGVFKIFGADTVASEVVIILAQVALNLTTIALLMHIAHCLFSERAATIAGVFWAISPPLLFIPTIFWETSFSTCLLTGLVALALHYAAKPSRSMWVVLGAYSGITALINPALLLSIIAISAGSSGSTGEQQSSGRWSPSLSSFVVFSPWPVRNARTFHAFIPLRTTVGFELWMGNHPGATGYLIEPLFPTFNQQELSDYIAHGELAYTNHKSQLARQYILAHPAEFLRLTALRTNASGPAPATAPAQSSSRSTPASRQRSASSASGISTSRAAPRSSGSLRCRSCSFLCPI